MNPFIGASRANLETWLAQCQEDLAMGKVLTGWTASDAGANHTLIAKLTVERRIELILAALSLIDPDTYPPAQIQRTRRTSPRYVW